MKITKVRTHVLEAKLSQPFAYSRAWYAPGRWSMRTTPWMRSPQFVLAG
jgi:hypothetical protein